MIIRTGMCLTVAVFICACAIAQPTRRALLIGINDYKVVGDLAGCVNDIELIRSVLVAQYGFPPDRITTLKNSAATRAGILGAIATLTQQAKPTDTIYIHYSGHGSRMPDRSRDEPDQWDETIVPHDSRQGGIFDISDDELNQAFGALAKKSAHLVVVLDSCHSGSATRGGATIRRAEDDLRVPPPPAPTARPAESPGDLREYGADYVLIAGCRPHELSNESDAGGARFGALSYNLARALRNAPPGATYRSVVEDARSGVTQTFPTQHPNIEGPRARDTRSARRHFAAGA